MPEAQNRQNQENGSANETQSETPANGGSSGMGRGVKTALLATAVGTAVAAAARSRSSSASPAEGDGGGDSTEAVKSRFQRATKRGEPFVVAAWEAARDSLEPLTKTGARQAGRFVAERSPDFVRETIIPPFVEGLTEDRRGDS